MKKTLLAVIILMFVNLSFAQEWPEDLKGEQFYYQEPVDIQMYLEVWSDHNYWGMPSPVGDHFYFGTLTFDVCDDINVARLEFDTMAVRTCVPSPWGGRFPETCYYMNPKDIVWNITLDWDEAILSYIEYDILEWGIPMASLIMEESGIDGVLTMGVMASNVGVIWWDEDYTWYKYEIQPRTAERRLPMPRRMQRRLTAK